ncbi:uncharacterized protein KNAG_0D03690 [Huiozyma naganishii CBS 8797]|uniref:Uncharacterized protein n=1 Tax=Huiozyma naganishii (strain ATCC MYA-139 / BCRC 22969 / CBS 8797 / KCTC 17520 / NBRC 10181 / NCYC 3082 / Yp74L-3) TaxID=1071383 RepID=J7R5I6_HUIN7|nr:hypothetical protein KNAG_0D03690 [Kazachstania naganishii CBS 8797]CCK70115.1 hypothetical protein KNAG_0D03690 [Kazachstania naganishii CBS 8797]
MLTTEEKRRQKFSQESLNRIKNDQLLDTGLLSRSQSSAAYKRLQESHEDRVALFNQIKSLDGTTQMSTKAHGLRKLREIIISVFDSKKENPVFIEFVFKVYTLTYEVYMEQRDFDKIGGIVLEMLMRYLPDQCVQNGFADLYVVYLSHWENNIAKAYDVIRTIRSGLTSREPLLQLCSLFYGETGAPRYWFQILQEQFNENSNQWIIPFLKKSGVIDKMQKRTLMICAKSYNQLSMPAFQEMCLQKVTIVPGLEKFIEETFELETLSDKTQVIYFKRRKVK